MDWAGRMIDRKSTTRFVIYVAGGAESWKSKKQSVVSASTSGAEYFAMRSAAQQYIWISRLSAFATGKGIPKPEIFVDIQGAI